MAINFTQFNTATPLTTSDYVVGYNAAGTAEIKTQIQDILNLKSDSDAQTLSFNETNNDLTISSGNTVSLSSLATTSYVNTNFFPLTGGTISGATRINNNLTIQGNISASGTSTFFNTIFTTTSALSVVHIGSGPAMWIGNSGLGDIASFYDIDQNVEVLHVGGNNGTFPNVGIKISTPNKDFTVNGEISANNTISDNVGNSNQWNQAYNVTTTYQSASSSFATTSYVHTNFLPLTGGTVTGSLSVLGSTNLGNETTDILNVAGEVRPVITGTAKHNVIVSSTLNYLSSVDTYQQVYTCPTGYNFLLEETTFFIDTVTGGTSGHTMPAVRIWRTNSGTANQEMGNSLTFPNTQLLAANRWFRPGGGVTTTIGRDFLRAGESAYMKIETAYIPGGTPYTALGGRVLMSGYLIKI